MPDPAIRPGRPWIGSAAALAGILVLAGGLRAGHLGGPPLDYDEGVYWQSLRAVGAGHRLYASVFDSQPPLFLLLLRPLEALGGEGIAGARLGVLAVALAGVAAGFVAGRALAGPVAGLAGAAILAADPLASAASVTLQAEAPALGLALVAVALAADSRRRSGGAALVGAFLAGEAAGLAVLTKLLGLSVLLPITILLAAPAAGAGPDRARRLLAGAGGALAAAAAVLLPFAPDAAALGHQVLGLHLAAAPGGPGGVTTVGLRELPLAALALAGLGLSRRRRPLLALTAGAWLAASLAELAALRPLQPHHVVALVPPLALAASGAVAAAADALSGGGRRAAGTVVGTVAVPLVALALVAGSLSVRPTAELSDTTASASVTAALIAALPRGSVLIGDDQYVIAAAGDRVPPELVDTSHVRIDTGDLDSATVERLAGSGDVSGILFASGRLDSLPGLRRWAETAYPRALDLGHGAVLRLRG